MSVYKKEFFGIARKIVSNMTSEAGSRSLTQQQATRQT